MPDSSIAPFAGTLGHSVASAKYMAPHGETHWDQLAARVAHHPMAALQTYAGRSYAVETAAIERLIRDRKFIPGGRYLYSCGNDFHQTQNCLLLRAQDTREGWAALKWKSMMSLLTGAGIGSYYGDIRPGGSKVSRTGGIASGPLPLAIAVNEQGRAAVQGGDRRAAIWGGLLWSHGDIDKWNAAKDWPQYIKDAKADWMRLMSEDFEESQRKYPNGVPADLDMTNISVCLDDDFFAAYDDPMFTGPIIDQVGVPQFKAPDGRSWHEWATKVYWDVIDRMTQTGEPGFSVDLGDQRDEKLRNACTEIVSADDSDICNLGGLSLARFTSVHEFEQAVKLGVLYLTAGTVYSDVPYYAADSPDGVGVDTTRNKNRRLGLDLMGVHEFLLKRGLSYGTPEAFEALDPYMRAYERSTEFAHEWQSEAGLSLSIATRAGSPTGTRGVVAETTTGWEPVFATAYERRVITSKAHEQDEVTTHVVVDPTIKRLVDEGWILPNAEVEDSYSLASEYERRFAMQAYAQSHTDQAISMTINLPYVMKDPADRKAFGDTLYKYLPKLRGITVYPDGAIAGQPITKIPLGKALGLDPEVWESEEKCASGVCGI